MATRYWVGGSADWQSTSSWSATSGGAGGASVPTSSDDVVFDSNSGAHSITSTGVTANCRGLTIEGTGDPLFSSIGINIYGSVNTFPRTVGACNFNLFATVASDLYFPSGSFGGSISFKATGPFNFRNAPSATSTSLNLSLSSGAVINTNDFDLTLLGLRINSGTTVNFGASTITMRGSFNIYGGATLDAGTSTIIFPSGWYISDGEGVVFSNVIFQGAGSQSINGQSSTRIKSLTANGNLSLGWHGFIIDYFLVSPSADLTITFLAGATYSVGSLSADGSSHSIKLRSSTLGAQYTLAFGSSGSAAVSFIDVQDSVATGTNTPIDDRTGGVNSGNNSGWSFGTLETITETTSGGGSGSLASSTAVFSLSASATGGSTVTTSASFQPLPEKDYEYRVFDKDFNFIGIWQGVTSDPDYVQSLNQNATELTVQIARAPDNRTVSYDFLQDENDSNILDENSSNIVVQTTSANAVGPGTDVQENLNVDVYTFYGGYDSLQDENGDDILDENSEQILTQYGAPNGKRVYSGYIADYELNYGDVTGVTVLVVPHATETSHYVFKDADGNTTVNYGAGTDPVQIGRDAMDDYIGQGGIITYDDQSMPLSGVSGPAYDFKLQTTRDTIDQTINMLPSGYYQYVDPGERKQYILERGTTADHTFYYQKHVSNLNLKKSITQLVNKVYYIGGDDGTGVSVYTYDEDATSIADYRPGLDRPADSRVATAASAHLLAQQEIGEFKDPRYTTSVTISDAVYDIESIKLGQMIAFKNFGTFVDGLLLQVVTVHRQKHSVTLDLDMLVPNDTKRIYELKKQLQSQVVENIPAAPSL